MRMRGDAKHTWRNANRPPGSRGAASSSVEGQGFSPDIRNRREAPSFLPRAVQEGSRVDG